MAGEIGTKIDHAFNETERALSIGAAIPVIGTLAGLSKVLMGVGQTIVGIAGGILTLPARCMDNSKLNDRFWTHAKHGVGNVAAGTLEAIPLVGTGMYFARILKCSGNNSAAVFIKTNHEDKFMPYTSLTERDLVIDGLDDDVVPVAKQLFNDRVAENLILNPDLSYEEKYTIAEQAIIDAQNQYRQNEQDRIDAHYQAMGF